MYDYRLNFWSIRHRILYSLYSLLLLFFAVLLVNKMIDHSVISTWNGFVLTLLTVVCCGAASSVMQGSLYALAAMLGDKYGNVITIVLFCASSWLTKS